MLYNSIRFLLKKSIELHYLEVKALNIIKVPKSKPILIAAGHPNSFLDAIIIAILIERPLHFLARSDVFKNKTAAKVLRGLNLIPIYRLQEGKENLTKNENTFKECYEVLENNGAVLIFAEGISVIDKKIRPIKKGLARIAYGFAERTSFKRELKIVPLGINYDRPTEFRTKLAVAIGEVRSILDFDPQRSKNKFIGSLNEYISEELHLHTIEVEPEDELVYKTIAELDSCFQENSLTRKIKIANRIKASKTEHKIEFEELNDAAKKALGILQAFNLNFRKLKANHGLDGVKVLSLIALLPLAIIAIICNLPPYLIAKVVSDKKVTEIEFYASVRLSIATVIWVIWSLSLTIAALAISPIALAIPVLLYLGLKFYLWYYDQLKYIKAAFWLKKLKDDKSRYNTLQKTIKSIYRLRAEMELFKMGKS